MSHSSFPRATTAGLTFRPITKDDQSLLATIYAGTRAAEMELVDWDEAQKEAFLQSQFAAQHQYYMDHYRDARFEMLLYKDQPIGRLYVDRGPHDIRIIDIALLPEQRNHGFGTCLLQDLLEEARQAGQTVSIHVEQTNPALTLYHRLGFTPIEEQAVYLLMEWNPALEAVPPADS